MSRRSQLQRQVLSLYKSCLRASETKPGFRATVQSEFKRNAEIPRTEVMRVEHLLRAGQRKLKMLQDPHVSGMGSFVDDTKK